MANKFLDDNGVLYLWGKIKSLFVQKEDGKGLSSNDFTDAEKTKLSGIASGANKYTHPTYTARDNGFYKVTVDGTGHVSNVKTVEKADITGLGIPEQDTTYDAATTTANGLMSSTDKAKLDGIAEGANKYVHPTTAGNKHIPTGGKTGQVLKYGGSSGTAAWADPDAIAVDDALSSTSTNPVQNKVINDKLTTMDSSISANTTKLAGIEEGANKYVHPTTAGNKHIPAGGSSGQILRWSAAGTATWGADNDTTYEDATQTVHGLMSINDKKKLDGIASGATKITVDSALSSTSTNPVQNKAVNTELGKKINTSARGAKNGVASLDANGLVPSSQLPSYVDDVIEGYYSDGAFYKEETHKTVITGETGKIYVDLTTNMSYRYGGTEYVKITSSDMVAITNAELDTICV